MSLRQPERLPSVVEMTYAVSTCCSGSPSPPPASRQRSARSPSTGPRAEHMAFMSSRKSQLVPGPVSDKDLLVRHAAGDLDAFGEIVRRHRDRMWAVALRTLGDPEEASDALQD